MKNYHHVLLLICGCLIFLGGMTGCGPRGPKVQMVHGSVTLDGKPFDGVTITFAPVGEGNMGFATTDEKGNFRISTLGARPATGTTTGTYKVSFDKLVPDGPQPTQKELADPNFDPSTTKKYNIDKVVQKVPKKYLSGDTSGIEMTVEKGENVFDFKLTSK